MKKLFAALSERLAAGQGAVLCSVVSSSGSTPRGAGAKMLVLEDGGTAGTVGGGAVELQAGRLARTLLAEKRSEFASYRLSPNDIADIGMICGGNVRLYFQYFAPSDRELLDSVMELLDGSRAAWLITEIGGDGSWRMGTYDREHGLRHLPGLSPADVEPLLGSRGILSDGSPALYAEPLNRAGTAYLFGGGHVGQELAHILALTDFRVVVWDERSHVSSPDAAEVLHGPYENALDRLDPITPEDYVVIMTPGHQGDYTVLAQALRTPARYIGCIGSRRKAASTWERLLSDGFTAAEIHRVCTPIGLPIGGETPAEIAVSVAAQMIACRAGKELRHAAD